MVSSSRSAVPRDVRGGCARLRDDQAHARRPAVLGRPEAHPGARGVRGRDRQPQPLRRPVQSVHGHGGASALRRAPLEVGHMEPLHNAVAVLEAFLRGEHGMR
jgi:hypothetical protein